MIAFGSRETPFTISSPTRVCVVGRFLKSAWVQHVRCAKWPVCLGKGCSSWPSLCSAVVSRNGRVYLVLPSDSVALKEGGHCAERVPVGFTGSLMLSMTSSTTIPLITDTWDMLQHSKDESTRAERRFPQGAVLALLRTTSR